MAEAGPSEDARVQEAADEALRKHPVKTAV